MTIGGHNEEKHLSNSQTQVVDFTNSGQFRVDIDYVAVCSSRYSINILG
jgi:hypothetical protein